MTDWNATITESQFWHGRFGYYCITRTQHIDGEWSVWEACEWNDDADDFVPIWDHLNDDTRHFDTLKRAKDFVEEYDDGFDLGG